MKSTKMDFKLRSEIYGATEYIYKSDANKNVLFFKTEKW